MTHTEIMIACVLMSCPTQHTVYCNFRFWLGLKWVLAGLVHKGPPKQISTFITSDNGNILSLRRWALIRIYLFLSGSVVLQFWILVKWSHFSRPSPACSYMYYCVEGLGILNSWSHPHDQWWLLGRPTRKNINKDKDTDRPGEISNLSKEQIWRPVLGGPLRISPDS